MDRHEPTATQNEYQERSNPTALSTEVDWRAGVNRMRRTGGIAEDANALGKAQGHADVGTMIWMVGAE